MADILERTFKNKDKESFPKMVILKFLAISNFNNSTPKHWSLREWCAGAVHSLWFLGMGIQTPAPLAPQRSRIKFLMLY